MSNTKLQWEHASFNCGRASENPVPYIHGEWSSSDITTSSKGLLIRSLIIRTKPEVNLRRYVFTHSNIFYIVWPLDKISKVECLVIQLYGYSLEPEETRLKVSHLL